MSRNKNKWFVIVMILTVIAVLAGALIYERCLGETRVALVNYPDYVAAPLLDQELPRGVRVDTLKWTEKSGKELKNYDMIIFFGMGLNFTPRQMQIVEKLKAPVYVTASTRNETALNTVPEAKQVAFRAYFAGGRENFKRMLRFIRVELDGKKYFAAAVEPAKEVPGGGFYHLDEEMVFADYADYLKWYRASKFYIPDAPVAALVSGNGNNDISFVIKALHERKINAVAMTGVGRDLKMLLQLDPDLVIYFPHGRLAMDKPEEAVAYLAQKNIPLLCPIKVNQLYSDFTRDQRGMTGGMLSQSVIMPELDGGAVPFVLSALFVNNRNLQEFRIIPDRLEKFANLAAKLAMLRRLDNKDKKIAIIYYKEPGKNAMVASGLEVGDSLFNFLKNLEKNGYTTGNLPGSAKELNQMIQEHASVFNAYAVGAEADFMAQADPVRIDGKDFEKWARQAMPADLFAEAVAAHGPVPAAINLPNLRFGNILLLPQGAAGSGANENTIVHGVKQIPPYRYQANYFYCRYGFKADAVMHFGTHGSMEFTPYKQVALSSYDWPDILIGDMPHYYLYVTNNVGEALIAKRRSYATMVSHITAPFMNSGAYGKLAELDDKMNHYEVAAEPALKQEYAVGIVATAKELGIDKEFALSAGFAEGNFSGDDFSTLHSYLHESQNSNVNRGLYVIGRPYSDDEAAETARIMAQEPLALELFLTDVKHNLVDAAKRDDKVFFDRNYLQKAAALIDDALADPEHSQGKPGTVAVEYKRNLLASTGAELAAVLNAFNGGFLLPSPGGDPVANPAAVPAGRNLYGIDPDRTPTRESYGAGKKLGQSLIDQKLKESGEYPKKVAFSLWGGEFIRTQGTDIGEIFFLLGVEPVWDSRGRVIDVSLISLEKLGRPRIDVVVQTSGQFRGAATGRMRLIDKAVRLAAEDTAAGERNFVRENTLQGAARLIASGMSPEDAKTFAVARIFGGLNGAFGTNITGMIQSGDRWDDPAVLAERYLHNMGALYTDTHWGEAVNGVFESALINTDAVVQSRSSNTWGPLSLDHVYEFTGGISMAAQKVTGKLPAAYFNDMRTPGRVRIQSVAEAAMVEARSTVLNPKYVKEMLAEGPGAAGQFAEVMRNTYGWEVTRPGMIRDHLWEEYKKVYVDDSLKLNVREFFDRENPYAFQEMTGVMLETIRKGYWDASSETVKQIAEAHVSSVNRFGAGCSNYVCNNPKIRGMIAQTLAGSPALDNYRQQVDKVLSSPAAKQQEVSGQTLKEEKITPATTSAEDTSKRAQWLIGAIVAVVVLAVLAGSRRKRHRR